MSSSPALRVMLTSGLAVVALTLAGCGGDGADDDSSAEPSSSAGEAVDATDTSDETAPGAEEPEAPDAPAVDICSAVTAEEMGAVLQATVTVEEIPGGGCNFAQEDPRAVSVALNQSTDEDFNGGFEGARTGITGVVQGEVEDVAGVGDDAFLVVGPFAGGGGSSQGAGAVLLGDAIIQVTLLQGLELPADEVRQVTTDVLTLIGSKG